MRAIAALWDSAHRGVQGALIAASLLVLAGGVAEAGPCRPPPPDVGMHPIDGWKTARAGARTSRPRMRALRVVVTPGETGAPTWPTKSTWTAALVATAVSPPTTAPGGHVIRYSDGALRCT